MQEPSLRVAQLLRLPTRTTTCRSICQITTPYLLQLLVLTLTTPTSQFPLHPIQVSFQIITSSLHWQLAHSLITMPSHNPPLLIASLVPTPPCPLQPTMGLRKSKRLSNSHPPVPFSPLGSKKLSAIS